MSHVEGGSRPTTEPIATDYEPWTWRRTLPALVAACLGVLIVVGAIRPPGLSHGAPFRVAPAPLILGGFAVVTAIAALITHRARYLRMAIPAVFIGLILVWLVATQVAEDERRHIAMVVDGWVEGNNSEALCADISPLTHTRAEMLEIRQTYVARMRHEFAYPPPDLVFDELVNRCLAG